MGTLLGVHPIVPRLKFNLMTVGTFIVGCFLVDFPAFQGQEKSSHLTSPQPIELGALQQKHATKNLGKSHIKMLRNLMSCCKQNFPLAQTFQGAFVYLAASQSLFNIYPEHVSSSFYQWLFLVPPNRWDRWHSPSPNWQEKYHLYTTYQRKFS